MTDEKEERKKYREDLFKMTKDNSERLQRIEDRLAKEKKKEEEPPKEPAEDDDDL